MDKSLSDKITSLSPRNRNCFFHRLYNVLNDRYSSFKYGIKGKDYNNLPKEKVEGVEKKIYEEMFNNRNSIDPHLLIFLI